jgi:hypothetical protein
VRRTLLKCPLCGDQDRPLHEIYVRTAFLTRDGVRFLKVPICHHCVSKYAILIPDTLPLEILERSLPDALSTAMKGGVP